jgi:hypothetical protein
MHGSYRHGQSRQRVAGKKPTGTYNSHSNMIQRCFNEKHPRFNDYGGRGITVCDRWLNFENFYADMGDKPKGKSLDRIDNNGDYCPNNCRWATVKEQNTNQRMRKVGKNNKTGIVGVSITKNGRFKAEYKKIHLGTFKSLLDACCVRKSAENRY